MAQIFESFNRQLNPARLLGRLTNCFNNSVQVPILDGEKILPKSDVENILITSALPYVNNVPHLGNLIGSVLSADCFARFCKSSRLNTLFICGTDEYGTATETKALEEKVSPRALCDKYHILHKNIYDWFNIQFDYFGRTTTPLQTEICQDIFCKLYENKFIEEKEVKQLYCENHKGFLADRYIEGTCPRIGCGYTDARGDQCDGCGHLMDPLDLLDAKCKLDQSRPVLRHSQHFFLELDKLEARISAWIEESSKAGGWSKKAILISKNWMKEKLHARCITRDLKWGVSVPESFHGFEDKVFYVWFDAPIGYLSITANYTTEWKRWWDGRNNVKLFQFIGKDNVPFHSVVFPGCQLGTNQAWTMAHHLSATEYLQYETGKFSKSRGIGVFGDKAKETGIPADVWRYYLLSTRPESSDTQFNWNDLVAKNNSELLGNLGNLVNRVVKFTHEYYSGIVPFFYCNDSDPTFSAFKEDITSWIRKYNEQLTAVKLRAGIETAMHISSRCNLFLQANRLGSALFRENPARCAAVIGLSVNALYILSAVVSPYMPHTAKSIAAQLNLPLRSIPRGWSEDIFPGHQIGNPVYLFTKIDESKVSEWRRAFGGQASPE